MWLFAVTAVVVNGETGKLVKDLGSSASVEDILKNMSPEMQQMVEQLTGTRSEDLIERARRQSSRIAE